MCFKSQLFSFSTFTSHFGKWKSTKTKDFLQQSKIKKDNKRNLLQVTALSHTKLLRSIRSMRVSIVNFTPYFSTIPMENSHLEKSTTQTTSTLDHEAALDSSECDIEKQKSQASRKSLVLIYSVVMLLMSGYFCKKHMKHWKRWTMALGSAFYLIMRLSHAQSA